MLEELKAVTGHAQVHAKNWPKDAKALSGRLRRLAPLLHAKGVNAEKVGADQRQAPDGGWVGTDKRGKEGKADLPSSPSSGSTATAACTDVPGAVIRNQQPVKENDDRDVSDDQFAGFSDRQHAMPVLSDIEAAYEEPRIRGDTVGPPVRRFRERKRTPPFGRGKPLVYLSMTHSQAQPRNPSGQRSLSTVTLASWRLVWQGPLSCKLGRRVVFAAEKLMMWSAAAESVG